MNWAGQRRIIIVSIIALVGVVILAVTLIATLYESPSCTDKKQNQDEQGIDCGGSCAYLCTSATQPPVTLFTRAFSPFPGRTDIAAVVTNQNLTSAAKNVPYAITLYGAERTPVKVVSGTLDMPPAGSIEGGRFLVFVPSAFAGTERIASADLEVDASAIRWFRMEKDFRTVPRVGSYTLTNEFASPRITTTLENPIAKPLTNVKVVIGVYDAAGNMLAASQTIVPTIPAQGKAGAVFTWNAPFDGSVARVEIQPVIPLGAQAGSL